MKSDNGGVPIDWVALGDLDLAATEHVIDIPVLATTTHWWLVGQESGNIVFSSNIDLNGIDILTVEPLSEFGPWAVEGLINDLESYNDDDTIPSLERWIGYATNHDSHMTPDGSSADLWLFSSPGSNFGNVAVNMFSNDIPVGGQNPVPEPATCLLLLFGFLGMIGVKKKFS